MSLLHESPCCRIIILAFEGDSERHLLDPIGHAGKSVFLLAVVNGHHFGGHEKIAYTQFRLRMLFSQKPGYQWYGIIRLPWKIWGMPP
jgi:hypothetical protein